MFKFHVVVESAGVVAVGCSDLLGGGFAIQSFTNQLSTLSAYWISATAAATCRIIRRIAKNRTELICVYKGE